MGESGVDVEPLAHPSSSSLHPLICTLLSGSPATYQKQKPDAQGLVGLCAPIGHSHSEVPGSDRPFSGRSGDAESSLDTSSALEFTPIRTFWHAVGCKDLPLNQAKHALGHAPAVDEGASAF